jgi:hypothetical protein
MVSNSCSTRGTHVIVKWQEYHLTWKS